MRTAGLGESAWTATIGVSPMSSRTDSKRATRASLLSARDRGEDGDHVAVRHLGVELLEVPDVVVVAVHVDELVDAARLVDELVRESRIARAEVGEDVAHRGAVCGHGDGAARVRPQECGKADLDGHEPSLQVRPDGSGLRQRSSTTWLSATRPPRMR